MAKIKINGDSSGYVEIAAPNAAYNNTLELGPGTKILTDKNTHTGNIGIGTDNPTEILHLNGATTTSLLRFTSGTYGVSSSDGSHIGINFGGLELWHKENNYLRFGTNNIERLRITSAGDMGLGTNSPNTYTNYNTLTINGTTGGEIDFEANGTLIGDIFGNASGLFMQTRTQDPIVFSTYNGSNLLERLRITSGGKVGVNETAPAADLVVKQSGNTFTTQSQTVALFQRSSTAGHGAKIAIVAGTGGSSDINFGDTADEDIGIIQYYHTDNSLRFTTNTSERLRVDDDGRILVGPGAIATPKCGHAGIDIPNNDWAIIMGGSDGNGNRANNANKDGRFAGAHYVNAEEPVGIIRCTSGASANELHMGGGTSLVNAATQISLYTAANTTTTGGTERIRIKSDGTILMGGQTGSYDGGFVNLELRTDSNTVGGSMTLVNGTAAQAGATCEIDCYQNYRGAGKIVFGRENANNWQSSAGSAASFLGFHTNNAGTISEKLRITSAGKVSISSDGTADGLLTIKGNSDEVSTPSIRLLDGTDTREVSITNTSGDFVVSTHGTDNAIHGRIKIFESGIIDFDNGGASGTLSNKLRINTSTITCATGVGMAIDGGTSSQTEDASLLVTKQNNNDWALQVRNYEGTSNDYGFYSRTKNTASYAIGVYDADNSSWRFRVNGVGSIHATNTTVQSISDQRLKENIVDANSQWDDIKALRFRNFKWREDSGYSDGKTYLGLIAQEVEPISPNLVEINAQSKEDIENEVPDPEYKNVKYSIVWMKAVKALQEAQTRIETLETQLTDALARITALEGS